MRGTVTEVIYSAEQIRERVEGLAQEISRDYEGKTIVAICLLKGSLVFTSDLIRHIEHPLRLELMRTSSYGSETESSGSVKIVYDLDVDISGQDVLVIEDIVDTGRTLKKILNLLEMRKPKTLKVCSLLDKPSRRVTPIDIHYRGFTIDDHFVVGYGLDYDEYYRNLPYIGILDPDA